MRPVQSTIMENRQGLNADLLTLAGYQGDTAFEMDALGPWGTLTAIWPISVGIAMYCI
jgi:hypothetical protein